MIFQIDFDVGVSWFQRILLLINDCNILGQKIVTTTRSHGTGLIQQTLDILKPDQILKVGGAGHKV